MGDTMGNESLSGYVINMLNEGRTRDEVAEDLLQKGHDEKFVTEFVQESVKLR